MKNLNLKASDFKYISLGLMTIGTAGLYFAFKYDLNKRANYSYLIDNFITPSIDTPLDQLQSMENKIVYLKGRPNIEINAKDYFFDIDIPYCIYLQRKTEMYQSYETTTSFKDSKGNSHTQRVTKYSWSENDWKNSRNPKMPNFYKSVSYVSSPVKLGNFCIDPNTINTHINRASKNLNPKEFWKFQKYKPYFYDKQYKWFVNEFYFTNSNSSSKYVGDLRVSFKYLDLIPENGLSVIGKLSNGSIVPFSVNSTSFSIFFIKDHYETPDNLILSNVNGIKNNFYVMTSFFFSIICLGFRFFEYEKLITNSQVQQNYKLLNINLKSQTKISQRFQNIFKSNTFILYSLFFSSFIYFMTKFSETSKLQSMGVENLYSYNQLAQIQLMSDEVVNDPKFMGNKLEE